MNPDLEPLLEVPLQLEAVPPPHHLRPLPLDPHLLLSLRKLPLWMQSIVHCFESYISPSCKFLLNYIYKVNIVSRYYLLYLFISPLPSCKPSIALAYVFQDRANVS